MPGNCWLIIVHVYLFQAVVCEQKRNCCFPFNYYIDISLGEPHFEPCVAEITLTLNCLHNVNPVYSAQDKLCENRSLLMYYIMRYLD